MGAAFYGWLLRRSESALARTKHSAPTRAKGASSKGQSSRGAREKLQQLARKGKGRCSQPMRKQRKTERERAVGTRAKRRGPRGGRRATVGELSIKYQANAAGAASRAVPMATFLYAASASSAPGPPLPAPPLPFSARADIFVSSPIPTLSAAWPLPLPPARIFLLLLLFDED